MVWSDAPSMCVCVCARDKIHRNHKLIHARRLYRIFIERHVWHVHLGDAMLRQRILWSELEIAHVEEVERQALAPARCNRWRAKNYIFKTKGQHADEIGRNKNFGSRILKFLLTQSFRIHRMRRATARSLRASPSLLYQNRRIIFIHTPHSRVQQQQKAAFKIIHLGRNGNEVKNQNSVEFCSARLGSGEFKLEVRTAHVVMHAWNAEKQHIFFRCFFFFIWWILFRRQYSTTWQLLTVEASTRWAFSSKYRISCESCNFDLQASCQNAYECLPLWRARSPPTAKWAQWIGRNSNIC